MSDEQSSRSACENEWFKAAESGDVKYLQIHAEQHSNTKNRKHQTALMICEKYDYYECVNFLSHHEIGLSDDDGWTSLVYAARYNRANFIPILQKEIMMKDVAGWTALSHAACTGNAQCVEELLSETVLYYPERCDPTRIAQDNNHQEIIETIHNYVNENMKSLEYKQRFEEEHNSFQNIEKDDDWFDAAEQGDINSLKKFVYQFQSKRNKDGFTALTIAASHNNVKSVEFLAAFEIGYTSEEGWTALMCASYYNSVNCIPFLLKELGMQNSEGNSALHIACERDNGECAKLLTDEAIIVNNDMKTPLQVAMQYRGPSCVEAIQRTPSKQNQLKKLRTKQQGSDYVQNATLKQNNPLNIHQSVSKDLFLQYKESIQNLQDSLKQLEQHFKLKNEILGAEKEQCTLQLQAVHEYSEQLERLDYQFVQRMQAKK